MGFPNGLDVRAAPVRRLPQVQRIYRPLARSGQHSGLPLRQIPAIPGWSWGDTELTSSWLGTDESSTGDDNMGSPDFA